MQLDGQCSGAAVFLKQLRGAVGWYTSDFRRGTSRPFGMPSTGGRNVG